jgi:triphosphoribosyl-dephospho-CoA synthase
MTPGERAALAIREEATAIKAGNVHPYASFEDMKFEHFVTASHAIGAAIDRCSRKSVGATILASTQAMLDAVGINTSLGTILLMVPMTRIGLEEPISSKSASAKVQMLIHSLSAQDTADIYEAIRITQPGGLGASANHDVRGPAPKSIFEAMQIASSWDDVAWQYANGYEHVLLLAVALKNAVSHGLERPDAIRSVQADFLSQRPDSLIVRKHGQAIGREVQRRAAQVVAAGEYGSPAYEAEWLAWDQYLRDPAERKNPGTTADLIAAALVAWQGSWI